MKHKLILLLFSTLLINLSYVQFTYGQNKYDQHYHLKLKDVRTKIATTSERYTDSLGGNNSFLSFLITDFSDSVILPSVQIKLNSTSIDTTISSNIYGQCTLLASTGWIRMQESCIGCLSSGMDSINVSANSKMNIHISIKLMQDKPTPSLKCNRKLTKKELESMFDEISNGNWNPYLIKCKTCIFTHEF